MNHLLTVSGGWQNFVPYDIGAVRDFWNVILVTVQSVVTVGITVLTAVICIVVVKNIIGTWFNRSP